MTISGAANRKWLPPVPVKQQSCLTSNIIADKGNLLEFYLTPLL